MDINIDLANTVRMLTMIFGAICGGLMARFYWARRTKGGMPPKAMVAYFLMLFYVIDGTRENWNTPWDWTQTPIALAAFVFTLWGVVPYMQFGRHHQSKESS